MKTPVVLPLDNALLCWTVVECYNSNEFVFIQVHIMIT